MEIKTPKIAEAFNIANSIKEYYRLKNAEKVEEISKEEAFDLKNFHINNTLFLTTKWLLIGLTIPKVASSANDLLSLFYHNVQNSSILNFTSDAAKIIDYNTLTSAIILSGALCLTVAFGKYKDLNIVEHKGLQSYKNELLSISRINHGDIKDELSTHEIYKTYLIGNHLYDENQNKMISKIKKFTKTLIYSFKDDEKKLFESFKDAIKSYKYYEQNENNNYYKKQISSLNNKDDFINIEMLKKYKSSELNQEGFIEKKIKDFNNNAIEVAIIHYTNQNLQLLLARVIKGVISNGIDDENIKILKKMANLKDVTSVKDFDTKKIKVNEEIKNISRISNDILNGRSIFNKKDTLVDIMKKINPEMVTKDKIKYGTFNSYIIKSKKDILQNKKNSEFKSYVINEIEFKKEDLEDFENFIILNEKKIKKITKNEYIPKKKI